MNYQELEKLVKVSSNAFPYKSEFQCRNAILRKVSQQLKTPIP